MTYSHHRHTSCGPCPHRRSRAFFQGSLPYQPDTNVAIPVGSLVHLNGLADIQSTTAGRIPYNTILIPRNKCVNIRLSIVIGLLFRTCIARQPVSHTRFGVINLKTNTTDDIVVHVLSYVVHLGEHPCVGFLRQLVAIKQAAAIAQPLGITTTMIAIKRICSAQLVLGSDRCPS